MIRRQLTDSVSKATGVSASDVDLEVPVNTAHGDYSTNVALKHNRGNPKEYAESTRSKLLEDSSLMHLVSEIEIAGPGFINFKLSPQSLVDVVREILEKSNNYGKSEIGKDKTVLVEYSSPNIAKGFGIGHLRSTIIGQALFNVYSFLGYRVIGENHLGDWGTQFGMVLAQLDRKGLEVEKQTVADLERIYVEFNKELDEDPSLRDLAKDWFKRLENGDEVAKKRWEVIRETSINEFERVYNILGVNIENAHGESFYEDKMHEVIEEFRAKGLSKMSEGAEIVELEGLPPAMLVKSDGTTTYFTRDLAAIKYRLKTWSPDLLIYEVGSDQVLHFRQVFAAAKEIGWGNMHFEHIAHGLIRFPEGKMSTRRGKTIKLEDVLNEAIHRAKDVILQSETNRGLTDAEVDELAKSVGVGAVKYYDLSHSPTSEIIFDWEKMFVLQGNSGPYLQYTYARTQSILQKSQKNIDLVSGSPDIRLTAEEEGVMRHLVHFPEVVETVGKSYSPNILTNYLYELASKFNSFYGADKVLGGDKEEFRLALTNATGQVLKNGLTLLGIDTPGRM